MNNSPSSLHPPPSVHLKVHHRHTSITLSVSISTTLYELCHQHLSILDNLPADPDQLIFKLILKKPPRTLISPSDDDHRSMAQLGFSSTQAQSPILLITTERSQVDRNERASQEILRRDLARREALKKPTKLRDTTWDRTNPEQSNYRFHDLQLLPNLPHESRRKALIDRLAKDPSITQQMIRFKLSVGSLGELHPWIDPDILGLNRNYGQSIRLRLLTDDLQSVRPFDVVRRVLSHELAHNHFGPHHNQFKELDSKIHKGMLAYDDQVKASSYRLGGELGDHYEPETREIELHCSTTTDPIHLPSHQTLGATGSTSSESIPDPKTAAAQAAIKRACQNN